MVHYESLRDGIGRGLGIPRYEIRYSLGERNSGLSYNGGGQIGRGAYFNAGYAMGDKRAGALVDSGANSGNRAGYRITGGGSGE